MKLVLKRVTDGFALPTILLVSVIMLIVLVTSVTAISSISTAIANQYYNQLAREAAESGLARARGCLRTSNYTPTWTTALPLKPNTGCAGETLAGVSAYVMTSGNVRTSFSIPLPETGANGYVRVTATATVELTKGSNASQVWRSYSTTTSENSRFNDTPQIAGGAGWKNNGHNGYMLAVNGTLYGWGDNNGQQLGDTAVVGTAAASPIAITLPSGVTRVKRIYSSGQGATILCILATHSTQGDQIYCRGIPGAGEVGLMPSVPGWYRFGLPGSLTATSMAMSGSGPDSACVIASDQQAYCAGENFYGTLGYGNDNYAALPLTTPVQFSLTSQGAGLTAVKVFVQDWHTCVLASDTRLYCAGANDKGQLGRGNTIRNANGINATPGRVMVPGDLSVADVRMTHHGPSNALFFQTLTDGRIFMSGSATYGTAIDGTFSSTIYSTPREITSGSFSRVIGLGEEGSGTRSSICVLARDLDKPNSGIWCVGSNTYGQLGNGNCTDQASLPPMINLGGETVSKGMSSGINYQMNSIIVITTDGNAWAWGDNTYGKLGTGAPLQGCNPTPAKVQLPAGVKAVDVANGDEYTTFILGDNGRLYGMGRNNNGQLGDGTTTNRNLPVEVKLPRQAVVY